MASEQLVRRTSTIVVAACVTVLGVSIALAVSPALRARFGIGPVPDPPAYVVGQSVDVPRVIFETAETTLIVFARSTCTACQRAGAAYRQAVDAATVRGVPAWVVTPQSDLEPERVYAAGLGVQADRVVHAAPGSIRLRSVPALMVVDRSGVIRHVWFAQPDDGTLTAILTTISTLGSVPVS